MSGVNEMRFQAYIADVLAKNPHWLPYALTGISHGMHEALEARSSQAASYHLAMVCALGIADSRRLTQEARATLLQPIIKAINEHPGGTKAEEEFLSWANGR